MKIDGAIKRTLRMSVALSAALVGAMTVLLILSGEAEPQVRPSLLDFQDALDRIAASIVPPGSVVAFAGDEVSVPAGWLLCDGRQVDRNEFSDLFLAIGFGHGQGNSESLFKLPDYRGIFLRGVDGTKGNDPDSQIREAMAEGGNTGSNVGTVQEDSLQNHRHGLSRHSHFTTAHSHAGDIHTHEQEPHEHNGTTFDGQHNHRVQRADSSIDNLIWSEGGGDSDNKIDAAGSGGPNNGIVRTDASEHQHFVDLQDATPGIAASAGAATGGTSVEIIQNAGVVGTPVAIDENTPRVSPETRPRNASVNWIIKF